MKIIKTASYEKLKKKAEMSMDRYNQLIQETEALVNSGDWNLGSFDRYDYKNNKEHSFKEKFIGDLYDYGLVSEVVSPEEVIEVWQEMVGDVDTHIMNQEALEHGGGQGTSNVFKQSVQDIQERDPKLARSLSDAYSSYYEREMHGNKNPDYDDPNAPISYQEDDPPHDQMTWQDVDPQY